MAGNVRARTQNYSNDSRQPGWVMNGRPLNLLPRRNNSKNAALQKGDPLKFKMPVFIFTISIVQALVFFIWTPSILEKLNPRSFRPYQVWRFACGLLIHHDVCHLFVASVGQTVLGAAIEAVHHWKRTAVIVIGGNFLCALVSMLSRGFIYGSSMTICVLWSTSIIHCHLNPEFFGSYSSHIPHVWGVLWLWLQNYFRVGPYYSVVNYITAATGGLLLAGSYLKIFKQNSWKLKVRNVCRVLLATCILLGIVGLSCYHPSTSLSSDRKAVRTLENIATMNKLSLAHQLELFTENVERILHNLID